MGRGVYIRTEKHRLALKVPRKGSGVYDGNKGKTLSEESKNKLRIFNLGKTIPQETRIKISETRKRLKLGGKKGYKHTEGWKIKMSGEGSPHWVKDRSKLKGRLNDERRSSAYVTWRMEVYKRDNFKCKILDENCKGRIEAHHILGFTKYPELRYQINNGITLCHFHHPFKKEEENKLSPYFQKLVAEMK